MASEILDPIAAALRDLVEGITLAGRALKGYDHEPQTFARVPAGAVAPPTISLGSGGATELRGPVGGTDWTLEYPVSLYFDLTKAEQSQALMKEGVEALIAAIDADPTLDGLVDDCTVTICEPFEETARQRALIGYQLTVRVETLVAD